MRQVGAPSLGALMGNVKQESVKGVHAEAARCRRNAARAIENKFEIQAGRRIHL
jgi:hypothetical protein